MRFLLSLIFIVTLASPTVSQTFSCGQGRIIYATKYTDLFTTFPGTAAVLETCTATCANQPAKDRQSCYLVACGLSCLVVGMNNCKEYFTQKSNVDRFKEGIEAICRVEETAAKRQKQEADLLSWSLADAKSSFVGYQDYLESCNSVCAHRAEAEGKIAGIHKATDDARWAEAIQKQTIGTMRRYLKNCSPTCAHSRTAQGFLDEAGIAANKARKHAIWGILIAASLPIHSLHIMVRIAM